MPGLYDTTIPNAIATLPFELPSTLNENSFPAFYSHSILKVPM